MKKKILELVDGMAIGMIILGLSGVIFTGRLLPFWYPFWLGFMCWAQICLYNKRQKRCKSLPDTLKQWKRTVVPVKEGRASFARAGVIAVGSARLVRKYDYSDLYSMYGYLQEWLRHPNLGKDILLKLVLMREFGTIQLEEIHMTEEQLIRIWEEVSGKKMGSLEYTMPEYSSQWKNWIHTWS